MYAFKGCSGLTSVTIGNGVIYISSSAFEGCSGLTSVTIPNSVINLDSDAFNGCSGLTSITIGSEVRTIRENAFKGCPELADVYCMAENVPDTSSDAFEGSYIEYATLHVPYGCIDAYKAAEPWTNFKNIVEDGGTGIDIIKEDVVSEPFDVYDMSGRRVLSRVTSIESLPQGIYIVEGKKILKK